MVGKTNQSPPKVPLKPTDKYTTMHDLIQIQATYDHYMDIQQSINLDIYRRFEEKNIEMAYPTQTIHLEKSV